MSIKVAITDDHPMVVAGLLQLLGSCSNIEVQATYCCSNDLLEGLKEQQPDVLLLDILLPDKPGHELAPIIREQYPSIRILAITSVDTAYYIREMMQHGCMGYVLKNADRNVLREAIETVYVGVQYISPSLKNELLQYKLHAEQESDNLMLTRREKEVLQLIAKGFSSKEIAAKLNLSMRTVENHRKHLLGKFDARNMIALVRKSLDMGLIE